MWKYLFKSGEKRWDDVLDDFVDNYNHTKHRYFTWHPPTSTNQTKKKFGENCTAQPLLKISHLQILKWGASYRSRPTKIFSKKFRKQIHERVIRSHKNIPWRFNNVQGKSHGRGGDHRKILRERNVVGTWKASVSERNDRTERSGVRK